MTSTKKMIDRLYRDDNCSDEQKVLRFIMWGRFMRESLGGYKLSSKELELLKRVTS